MTPDEIMKGLAAKNRELTSQNEMLSRLSEDAAEKKKAYLIALTGKITALRIEGESITLVRELAKGDAVVAEMGYKWDIAEGVLLACRERIKDLREQIGTYRSLLTWLRTEMELTLTHEETHRRRP